MNQTQNSTTDIASELFIAGDLHVDVGQQRVTRAGIEIALPNLSFQLLLALIRAAPNVLSNDLLMARVWPGLIVSPETVAKRVNLLREALGDSAQEPRYIAGVRSRGYRLVAAVSSSVRQAPPAEDPLSAPAVATPPDALSTQDTPAIEPPILTAKSSRIWWLVLPVLLTAIVAIVIGLRMVNRARVVGSQLIPQNPLREPEAIGARASTVAVLPFDNISADAADAYLAQGLPEMILNRLSRIDGLSVIARNSSFVLDTRSIDSSEIGRRLNSGYLIGGSVQREADRLRVAVHLVDTAAGRTLSVARKSVCRKFRIQYGLRLPDRPQHGCPYTLIGCPLFHRYRAIGDGPWPRRPIYPISLHRKHGWLKRYLRISDRRIFRQSELSCRLALSLGRQHKLCGVRRRRCLPIPSGLE
jgi:TolB-like protein/DNA-binding winged helix-turn-helix (wHTH) protein